MAVQYTTGMFSSLSLYRSAHFTTQGYALQTAQRGVTLLLPHAPPTSLTEGVTDWLTNCYTTRANWRPRTVGLSYDGGGGTAKVTSSSFCYHCGSGNANITFCDVIVFFYQGTITTAKHLFRSDTPPYGNVKRKWLVKAKGDRKRCYLSARCMLLMYDNFLLSLSTATFICALFCNAVLTGRTQNTHTHTHTSYKHLISTTGYI